MRSAGETCWNRAQIPRARQRDPSSYAPRMGGKYLALLGGTFSPTGKIPARPVGAHGSRRSTRSWRQAAARSDPAPASRRRDLRIEQALLRQVEDDLPGPILERALLRRPALFVAARRHRRDDAEGRDASRKTHRDAGLGLGELADARSTREHASAEGLRPRDELERLSARESSLVRRPGCRRMSGGLARGCPAARGQAGGCENQNRCCRERTSAHVRGYNAHRLSVA
jgi:hypothetical protein